MNRGEDGGGEYYQFDPEPPKKTFYVRPFQDDV